MKIHLGCGNDYRPGWCNVDNAEGVPVDVRHDLRVRPWPFADGCADELFADQVLEHLPDTVGTVAEIHRVLKPGATATVLVPFVGSYAAWNDPTHVRFFTPSTFAYFEPGHDSAHYTGPRFAKVEARLYCARDTALARARNLLPFRGVLRWFFWSMADGVEARLTK